MARGRKTTGQKTQASVSAPAPAPVVVAAAPDTSHLRLLVVDARLFAWALALVAAVGFLWLIRGVLVTLLFVAVLAFVGAPVVRRLERRMPRSVAAGLFVVGAGLVVIALFSMVLPPLVSDVAGLFSALPGALTKVADWAGARFGIQIPTRLSELSSEASKELLDQVLPIAQGGTGLVKTGALGVMKGAMSALSFFGQLFLIPVLAFFVLAELPAVKELLSVLVTGRARTLADHYLPLVDHTLSKLVRGQILVASIMAAIYVVGLSISRVPFALAIAVLAGAAYLIPFASGAVCLVLAALFSVLELQGAALPPIVGAVITVVVVQIVESYVLTPRIVGAEAGLSPLAAVLAVLLGGAAAGFLGVVFALPAGAVIALILREETRRRGGVLVKPAEASS